MRTVLIAHFNPRAVSGAEKAIVDMTRASTAGWRFLMMTPGRGKLYEYYSSIGLDVWPRLIHTRRRKYPGLHTLQSIWLARQLKGRKVDAVVCNTFAAASRVGLACRLARVPYAIYVREFIRPIALHRRILDRATQVLAVSEDVKSYLSTMMSHDRLHVCYDNVTIAPLRDRAERHRAGRQRLVPFPAAHKVVGIVGRITTYKQQDLFVRAIPGILARHPDARFVVVGSAQEKEAGYEQGLRDLARELQIQDRVAFMGDRADAVEIMTELAALCVTSDREPFPRVILEAQAVGCPVVAADTGGCPEMVEHGVTGLLFPSRGSNATRALAASVVRILDNPGEASGLVRQASAKLEANLGSDLPVRRFESLVSGLFDSSRKAS